MRNFLKNFLGKTAKQMTFLSLSAIIALSVSNVAFAGYIKKTSWEFSGGKLVSGTDGKSGAVYRVVGDYAVGTGWNSYTKTNGYYLGAYFTPTSVATAGYERTVILKNKLIGTQTINARQELIVSGKVNTQFHHAYNMSNEASGNYRIYIEHASGTGTSYQLDMNVTNVYFGLETYN